MKVSFRSKTIIGIALIQTIALLVLVWSSVNYLRDSNQQAIAQRAEATIQLFAAMAQDSVVATDLAKLDSFVTEILKLPEIKYIKIYGQDRILAEGGDRNYLTQPFQRNLTFDDNKDGVLDIDTDISIENERFGRVEIGFSVEQLYVLVDEARNSLSIIALVGIISVAIFSMALGTYLTKSLGQLKDAVNKMKKGQLGIEVPVKGGDEVAEVAFAFNRMSVQMLDNEKRQKEYLQAAGELSDRLKKSELRMRTVLNTAIDGFIIIDSNGTMIEVNESAEETFGYGRDELIGLNVSILMPSGHADNHDSYLKRYLTQGDPRVIGKDRELTGLRRNGENFPMKLTVSEIKQDNESLFVGLVHDLTEKQEAENKLSYLEAIKNGIAEASLDALITIDEKGDIIDFNQAAEAMYGITREAVLGRDIAKVVIPEHLRQAHNQGMKHYLESGEGPVIGKRIEVPSIRNNGEEFPVELTVTPVNVDGKLFFTAFIRDITDQNRQKQELQTAMTEAEQANQAKSKFLASMSHEIRTPINAVLGAMELLQDGKMESHQKKYIQMATQSGQSLLSIVNNILDFSKIESGAMELTESELTVHQLVDDVIFMFASAAMNKKIEIMHCVDNKIPRTIVSDKGKLRQILINLVSNAIKFTQTGGVALYVELLHENGKELLKFRVVDSGIGIDNEEIPFLFQDFSQVDNQLSAEHDGSGLGLSICKSLVELLKGQITIKSQAGRGSEFGFTIPVTDYSDSLHPLITENKKINKVRLVTGNTMQKHCLEQQFELLNLQLVDDPLRPCDLVIVDDSMLNGEFHKSDGTKYHVLLSHEGNQVDAMQREGFDHVFIKPLMTVDLRILLDAEFSLHSEVVNSHQTQQITAVSGWAVLVVDDSDANQLIARSMLEKSGHKVGVADNGFAAIESVKTGDYDLVLMDVRMPKMDGLSATREIRQLSSEIADIPIIGLTANAVKEDLEKCLEAGMNSYLTKPVNREDMLKEIERMLEDKKTFAKKPQAEISEIINNENLIDKTAFKTLADDTSPELVQKMSVIFLDESKRRVQHIFELDVNSEISLIGDEAHTLKSTAITFGAPRLHQVSMLLEKACKDHSLETAVILIEELHEIALNTFNWFETNFESEIIAQL